MQKPSNNANKYPKNGKQCNILVPKMQKWKTIASKNATLLPRNAPTKTFLRDPKPRQLRPSLVQHRLFLLAAALQRRRAIEAHGGACPSRVCSTTRSRRANHDASHKIKYNKYSRFVFKYSKWHVVTRTRS